MRNRTLASLSLALPLPLVLATLLASLMAPIAAQQAPAPAEEAKKPAANANDANSGKDGAQKDAAPAKRKVPFLRPQGAYADLPEQGFDPVSMLAGGGTPPKPFFRLVEAIDGLAKLPEETVLLDLTHGADFNLPQLREVERAFARVRAAKKRVVCYLESADAATFQVAALADRVLMAEMGMLDLRSPSLGTLHLKDALDLLGIQVDVSRVGAFKGAVEPFLLPEMSPHLRKHYEAMLATMNADVVRRIASSRGLDAETVRSLQGKRLLLAKEALAAKLVDQLVRYAGARAAIAAELGVADATTIELADAMPKKKAKSRDILSLLSDLVRQKKDEEIEDPQLVVLHLSGAIADGQKAQPGSIVSGPSVVLIDSLAENANVKGVVVRVNSPGGSATASEAVRTALQRLAAKKPVVFSMGELAASGGYWITTIGRPIVAEAGTLTGSIGVFALRLSPGPLMRRIGVRQEIVALDEGPLLDAIDRPWSEAGRARIQTFVDDVYDRFLANVGASRKMTRESVDAIAGGRVWSGAQAVELGLVDAVGGLDDALAIVRKESAVAADVEVRHVPEPKSFADTIVASLFESHVRAMAAGGGAVDAGALRTLLARLAAYPEIALLLREALGGAPTTTVWATLPPSLRVR